ncbi:MAG TPA: Bcr/CflA family efflux MFS transporter [Steroidobacteraceae bacterium]|nr:Bcr/CflA family efflux MFS transporter [Steroidobacteraceae bacterium]
MTRNRVGSRSWILLLGLVSGLSTFGMASLVPGLPVMASALRADYGSIQFVLSAYLLALGLAQPVQGLLCDRFGRRPVVLAGFIAFAVASIAAMFAPSLTLLVLARFVQALGASVGTVVARAMVRDTHEPERAAVALAFITAVMGISPILSPIFGGIVVEQFGWRALFAMHAVVAFALIAWMAVSLQETRVSHTAPAHAAGIVSQAGQLLRDSHFLGYTMIYGCATGVIYAFITVGADLFEREFAIGPARFGLLWALLAAAFAAGAWFAGNGARRFGSRRVLHSGVAFTLLGAVIFAGAASLRDPRLGAYMLALIVLVAANGIVAPLSLAGAVSGHPDLAGLASGLSSSLAMLTTVAFAAVSGALYQGAAAPIAVLMIVGALGVAMAAHAATRDPLRSARR